MPITYKKSSGFTEALKPIKATAEQKQLRKIGALVSGVAKKKYTPIGTGPTSGETIKSFRIVVKGNTLTLSSINHPVRGRSGGRYYYKTSKVAKNTNKYEWYDRADVETQPKQQVILEDVVK